MQRAAASPKDHALLPGAVILQVVHALDDDAEGREVLAVARALLRVGARALVAGSTGALIPDLQAEGGEWVACPNVSFNPLHARRVTDLLDEAITRERIDIVHARDRASSFIAAIATKQSGAWLLANVPGSLVASTHRGWGRPELARGDRLIFDSHYGAQLAQQLHAVEESRAAVIPPLVAASRPDSEPAAMNDAAEIRAAWRVEPHQTLVYCPGFTETNGGDALVIEAVRILLNGGLRDVIFVLDASHAATRRPATQLRELARALGVAGLIRVVGRRIPRRRAYAAADLVALPWTEPCAEPAAVLTPQGNGRPVIAAALGVAAEYVMTPPVVTPQRRTGWLYDTGDVMALAYALAEAIGEGPQRWNAIGAQGRSFVEALCSASGVAGATLDLYKTLLETPRSVIEAAAETD